ncbi:hypothetical protein ABZP36_005162 [Zizania latifolia]
MEGKLMSPMAGQVARALDIPLPRAPRRLETMRYIAEYSKDPKTFDNVVLELARLDFELLRFLHLRELKDLSVWWREVHDSVKLSYARDRIVECYLWACVLFHEEEYSRARIIFTKVTALTSLMDDTYDVHATIEECHKLNVRDGIRRLFLFCQNIYTLPGASHGGAGRRSRRGCGDSGGILVACLVPDLVRASGEVARFLNDIASYKVKRNGTDIPSMVECYMAEHGVGSEAAVAAVATLVEHAWRTINQASIEVNPAWLPATRLVVNLTQVLEVIYHRVQDLYTFGTDNKAVVTNLFLNPIPV